MPPPRPGDRDADGMAEASDRYANPYLHMIHIFFLQRKPNFNVSKVEKKQHDLYMGISKNRGQPQNGW